MAEDRNKHLMEMDRTALNANIKDQTRGMHYGAALFALLIVAAFISAILDLGPLVVGLFLSTAAVGGIAMFIKGRNGS